MSKKSPCVYLLASKPNGILYLGVTSDLRKRIWEHQHGLVEGFTVQGAPGFTLAVQWHPEWKVMQDPVSIAIFRAWGDACRAYRLRGLRQ